jgi:hypothetical protein
MPEKLPITALAGILAAALRASGVVSGPFWTTATWSIVILALPIEAAWGYADSKRYWRSERRRWIKGSAVAAALLLVGALNYGGYRSEYRKDELRVNFQAPHPNQLGTSELTLNYLVLNKAQASILLEETLVAVVASTDFSNNTFRDSAYCKLVVSWIPGRSMMENWTHPGQSVVHHSLQKPVHFLAEANENWTKNPPFADDGKLDVAYYDPKSISIEGKELPPIPWSIEPSKSVGVSAAFITDPAPWDAHNVVTACGVIRYLSSDGRDTWAVCPAQIIGKMFQDGKPAGQTGGPFATTPYAFGRNSNDARCGVWVGAN